jgi:hypothetical protein
MPTRLFLVVLVTFCLRSAQGQGSYDWTDADALQPFEVYALASSMHTVDATPTQVINNPSPNQDLGFSPAGNASGARMGFVWRRADIGMLADLGFHKYSDHSGSTSLAPLLLGIRFYSGEQFRTSFFGEGLAGAYRWSVNSFNVKFTTVKGLVGGGGGMDIRLSRSVVFRLFELRILLAGARSGPLLTGSASTGLAWRF